jgi:adenylosuccinate synthase
MARAKAIIGANYGDEGKGLMTDYFAARERSIVVRFNGGAQAGHTVITPDGRRHVFSHFGAGSFADCPTFLSEFFIVNPILFIKEHGILSDIGITPIVFVDSEALVTTPYDMFLNQLVENIRGNARHGSCGVGINETVTRCLSQVMPPTKVNDLLNQTELRNSLFAISKLWLPQRLEEHGISFSHPQVQSFLARQEEIITQFLIDTETLLDLATITTALPKYEMTIFEGAQGLMLDEDRLDQFPHVTRSKTGLTNVARLAHKFKIEELQVTYTSRTYLTRHGQGPLKGECDWHFFDQTNIPNQFQGRLRFAPLDCQQMRNSILSDLRRAQISFANIEAHIALTWADQLDPPQENLGLPIKYISFGPKRSDICEAVKIKAKVLQY